MDPTAALLSRARRLHPALGARLDWMRLRRAGDTGARVVDALVRPGAVALDIGANRGLFSWALTRRVGAGGRVHAFEPNPEHAAALRALAARRPALTPHAVALSDAGGTATLHIPVFGDRRSDYEATLDGTAAREASHNETVEVAVSTLDDALGDDASAVGFVKCDVEGHEAALLRGAPHTLAALPTLLLEVEQRLQEGDVRDTFARLKGLGYEGWALRAGGLAPLAEFDLGREQLALADGELAHNSAYVNEFLFTARHVDVGGLRERAA